MPIDPFMKRPECVLCRLERQGGAELRPPAGTLEEDNQLARNGQRQARAGSVFGTIPVNERAVVDGTWVFAAGVATAIDGALRLAAELRGAAILKRARQSVQGITARREETARRVAAASSHSQAARTVFRNLPTSNLSWALSRDSD